MSPPRLTFRLTGNTDSIRITAAGWLDVDTAHLLCKVTVGTLRRYPTDRLELDLTAVTRLDKVGECAVQVSRREAHRRGVVFVVTGPPERAVPRRLRAVTGTICARRSITRSGRQ